MNIKKNVIEYFDSFGLNCQEEVIEVSSRLAVNYLYISTKYQGLMSILCGYYCLYYTNERSKRKTY